MTQVVRAETSADFLAAVPALAGYSVQNSLMCVAFAGNRTCGAFRLDLPPRRRTSDYRAVASTVVSMLARLEGATAVATIVYTDETFEGERGIPWLDFGRELVDRIESQGYRISDALCVAADGWAGYFERGYPRQGHPLTDISSSPLGATALEVRGGPVADISQQSRLAAVGPATVAAIDSLLNDPVRLRDVAGSEGSLDVNDWVEHCLERDEWSIPAMAWFLELAQTPSNRDVMMLQIAFGREVGVEEAASNARLHAIQRQTGMSMDDTVLAEIAAGRASLHDISGARMMGKSTVRPDGDRIERGIVLLRKVTAAACIDDQLAPLCMLAWLSWALGRGSAAGAFVAMALEIDSTYGMAQVLNSLCTALPEWSYVPQHADGHN